MSGKIDLIVKDSKTQLLIDGVDVSDHCIGYSITHADGRPRIIIKLLCSEINAEFEEGASITKNPRRSGDTRES